MVLPKSRIHFALGNSVGKGKATENLILRTSQGQSLKLTTSSHCEPLSGFHSCGCDLLTCLIPSGGSPIFQSYPVLWAALHTMAFHQGHCSSNQQLQRHSDLARHCNITSPWLTAFTPGISCLLTPSTCLFGNYQSLQFSTSVSLVFVRFHIQVKPYSISLSLTYFT